MSLVTVEIDGVNVNGELYDCCDYKNVIEIIKIIKEVINPKINKLGGRDLNLSEALTEGLACYYFGLARVNGSGSFDCYDPKKNQKVEVKSTQIEQDLTSFSPKAISWDYLLFIDLFEYPTIHIYKINPQDIMNVKTSKTETFIQQQKQRRRPHFSIKNKVIKTQNLTPIKTVTL